MRPSISTRFCHFTVLYLHLFLLGGIASVSCQYESAEEELVQPNRIDEVNSNFVCNSDGYFADVTYGCQFYHVCENANSPYDKPSFVKHTFSCVNGTVFNQMSFTCTRFQDSIPCESSPNYFYLNKRNGDPKAYFLTEEDIVKPTASSRLSLHSNSLPALPPPATSRPPVVLRPTAPYATSTPVTSNHRPMTLLQKSLDQPFETMINYSRSGRMTGDYDSSNSVSIRSSSSYSPQTNNPYEISSKYSNIKPGVKYSMKPAKSKYEPVKKAFGYDLPQSSYVEHVRPESNFLSRSTEAKVQYRPMVNSYKPSSPSKIDQLLAKYGTATEENTKDTFGYHRAAIESPKVLPMSSISQPKRNAFTPASFSKMYVENQKAAKYIGSPAMSAPQSNDIKIDSRDSRMPLYYSKQKMVESQIKTPSYTAVPFPTSHSSLQPLSAKDVAPLSVSKYDAAPMDETHSLIKSNQYMVPSSIRIIEPDNNAKAPLSMHANSDSSQSEPVKMSFVSKGSNDHQGSMADFGNLRVVKQVKGKNLLIDPSLENDPARDNIIAQVLEMLNKYN